MPGPTDDFSARLAAALKKPAAGIPAAPPAPAGAAASASSTMSAVGVPAPPPMSADAFTSRIGAALARARGEVPAPAGGADFHEVQSGETLNAIAAEAGCAPETIWNHPLNRQIRERRGSPNQLVAGDALYVPAKPAGAQPVGQGDYAVRPGDCISSIAMNFGFYPDTIWNHAANGDLKRVRKNMNVLLPGDRVTVPEKTRKDEAIAAEQRHRFKRKGCPEKLQVRFENEKKEPYISKAYQITIDGVTSDGITDGDGFVRVPIPPDARQATIVFPDLNETYEFDLGVLDPIESVLGVQQRLRNLGFYSGPMDGAFTAKTRMAVRKFQSACGLTPAEGDLNDATRNSILEKSGS